MNPRDVGLQQERTRLAWVRTGIAFVVTAILVLRSGMLTHSTILLVCSVVMGVISVFVLGAGVYRGRMLVVDRPSPPNLMLMRLVSATGVLVAGCCLWAFCA